MREIEGSGIVIWRLKHPRWLHLPILVALVVCIAAPILSRPWPPRARGYPRAEMLMPMLVVVWYLAFDLVESEFWAAAENGRKRFNRRLLLSSGFSGYMAGIQTTVFWGLNFSPGFAVVVGGVAVCLGGTAALEWLRRPIASGPIPTAGAVAENEIAFGRRWTYFTIERSRWIDRALIALQIVVPMFLIQGNSRMSWPWLIVYVPMIIPLLLATMVGTLQIQVNSERVILRSGLGFPLLRLSMAEISNVDVETFHPMADFGGWGVQSRMDGVKAYLFGGNRGVRVQARGGKKYVIGCREPERLASVIRAASPAVSSEFLQKIC